MAFIDELRELDEGPLWDRFIELYGVEEYIRVRYIEAVKEKA